MGSNPMTVEIVKDARARRCPPEPDAGAANFEGIAVNDACLPDQVCGIGRTNQTRGLRLQRSTRTFRCSCTAKQTPVILVLVRALAVQIPCTSR